MVIANKTVHVFHIFMAALFLACAGRGRVGGRLPQGFRIRQTARRFDKRLLSISLTIISLNDTR